MSDQRRGPTLQDILDYVAGRLDEEKRKLISSMIDDDDLLSSRVALMRALLEQPTDASAAVDATVTMDAAIAGRCPGDLAIVRYSHGGLVASAAERLELHLARCGPCRARLLQSTELTQVLGLKAAGSSGEGESAGASILAGLRHDPRARTTPEDACAGANRMAVMLYAAGDSEGALDRLDEALEHDPTRPIALFNHGRLLAEFGFSRLAMRSLSAYLRASQDDASEDLFRLQARELLQRIELREQGG